MARDVPLTDMQDAFVLAFTTQPGCIGNAAESARRAGYSESTAREIGRQLLDKPHVRAAIDTANRLQLSHSAATKAIRLLERTIDDTSAPIKVRVDAAKAILDRAGYAAGGRDDRNAASGKSLHQMTSVELEAIAARMRSSLEAGLIDVTPILVPTAESGDAD